MEPLALRFADDGAIPNHPRYAALAYRAAFTGGPEAAEGMLARNGWPPRWRAGVFPFHHFHSTAHEALAVAAGEGRLLLGGPAGQELDVAAGDVLVLPAGTGHKRLAASAGFLVVGAYPRGQDWDLRRGDPAEHDAAVTAIAAVPDPAADPVTGAPIGWLSAA